MNHSNAQIEVRRTSQRIHQTYFVYYFTFSLNIGMKVEIMNTPPSVANKEDSINQRKREKVKPRYQKDLPNSIYSNRSLMEPYVYSTVSKSNRETSLHFQSSVTGFTPIPYEEDEIVFPKLEEKTLQAFPSSKPQSSFVIIPERSLPVGRPLSPAPRFPNVSPGTAINL
jgi:hypothetical protein